jgi:hypothetical protein
MSKTPPKYRLHKPSGQAVVTLAGHDYYLGKWQTPESMQEYDHLVAEWLANGRQMVPREGNAARLSVNEVILSYWQHAEFYYRHADAVPTNEADNIRLALRPLKRLYGHTPAAEFDRLALESVREEMIREGHCRNRINKDVSRIRRLFRWAAARKLVPLSVYESLGTVEGLRAGRSAASPSACLIVYPLTRCSESPRSTACAGPLSDLSSRASTQPICLWCCPEAPTISELVFSSK